MTPISGAPPEWVPASCTLPTVEQPLRTAAFDDLFARDVLAVERPAPGRVRFQLRDSPEVAQRVAGLAMQETECCSFFTFVLDIAQGAATLSVRVDAAHEPVLASMAARAESMLRRPS